jgi:hypothetical protein
MKTPPRSRCGTEGALRTYETVSTSTAASTRFRDSAECLFFEASCPILPGKFYHRALVDLLRGTPAGVALGLIRRYGDEENESYCVRRYFNPYALLGTSKRTHSTSSG